MSNSKIKIGILTFHRAHNFGANLQACALCNRLNQEDLFECEIINFGTKSEECFYHPSNRGWIKRILRFRKSAFIRKKYNSFVENLNNCNEILSSDMLISDSEEDFVSFVKGKYDIIITGSDEVWRVDSLRGFPNPYWLNGDVQAIKVSYAASSRNPYESLSEFQVKYIKEALEGFAIVSVRDAYTKDLVDKAAGCDRAFITCDPSFVYDFKVPGKSVYDIVKNEIKLDEKKKNMLIMVTDKRLAYKLRKEFQNEYNLINVFEYHIGLKNVAGLSPNDWLALIKQCDVVITTYFHATCFSIINNTPFITFGSERSSKIEGLFLGADNNFLRHYIPDTASYLKRHDFREDLSSRMEKTSEEYIREYVNVKRNSFDIFLKRLKECCKK